MLSNPKCGLQAFCLKLYLSLIYKFLAFCSYFLQPISVQVQSNEEANLLLEPNGEFTESDDDMLL